MKTYIQASLVLALVLGAAAPAVADAAWYNPFSWFKKKPAPSAIENHDNLVPSSVATSTIATTTPVVKPVATSTLPKSDASTKKPLPPTAKPPVTTMPIQAKPVQKGIATSTVPSKGPATSTSATTTKSEEKLVPPSISLDPSFAPGAYVYPRAVKNELVALVLRTDSNGDWAMDSVTFRIVSDRLRSGDLNFSVHAGPVLIGDSSVINDSVTMNVAGRPAVEAITFAINGNVPSKGDFKVVVEKLTGHPKNTIMSNTYPFSGAPVEGPRFDI